MDATFIAKDKKQREGLNIWFKSGCKGTLEYCTGSGKSRCGILAAIWLFEKIQGRVPSILIISPTETIRDGWLDEFRKWKRPDLIPLIVSECIQTVHRWTDMHFDLVVADEIHNYLSIKYVRFFSNNSIAKILGLSAYIPNELIETLKDIAPIVDTLSTKEAEFLGLVTPYTIINFKLNLSSDEKFAYDLFSRKIDEHKVKTGKDNWRLIGKRKKLLYESETKYKIIKQLVNIFENEYGVVFTETIEGTTKVQSIIGDRAVEFHSKMKKPDREIALRKLSDGRTRVRVIVSPKALNEGANLPRVVWAIVVANTGKEKEQIQRLGRIIRIGAEGKQAIMIRLFLSGTQEYDWITTSQSDNSAIWIENIEEIKELWQKLS